MLFIYIRSIDLFIWMWMDGEDSSLLPAAASGFLHLATMHAAAAAFISFIVY